jgi:hypothetical protein
MSTHVQGKRVGGTLLLAAVCAMLLAAVGVSSAAAAPKGEYAVFSKCPIGTPGLSGCLVARTESGEVKLGNTTVPIVSTQTLQAGLINHGLYEKEVVGATLTKTPQKVPGGLLGLVKCNEIKGEGLLEKVERKSCEAIFENKTTGVNATTELAGPVALNEIALDLEEGTALSLPVKVKLENPLLGGSCYIGSNSEPIELELTTGTSGALKGKKGNTSTKAEGGILVISNTSFVDSAFTAPKANGCGPLGLFDGLIDSKLGLPATTGNVAVLNGTEEQANSELVEESEG